MRKEGIAIIREGRKRKEKDLKKMKREVEKKIKRNSKRKR